MAFYKRMVPATSGPVLQPEALALRAAAFAERTVPAELRADDAYLASLDPFLRRRELERRNRR